MPEACLPQLACCLPAAGGQVGQESAFSAEVLDAV